ncbi:MAG: hypothetical protein WCS01_07890, partial [bacterium]
VDAGGVARILLDHGANASLADTNNQTAPDVANAHQSASVLDALKPKPPSLLSRMFHRVPADPKPAEIAPDRSRKPADTPMPAPTRVELTLRDGAHYEGQPPCETNLYSGTALFTDGGRYTGQWLAGRRTGKGQFVFSNGDLYDGEWQADRRQGSGVYTFVNGDKYTGEWGNDRMHGQGSYAYADGSTLTGRWNNGQLADGRGAYTFPSGDRYDGEWSQGRMHGQGVYSGTNGTHLAGFWDRDRYIGEKRPAAKR